LTSENSSQDSSAQWFGRKDEQDIDEESQMFAF